MSPFHFSVLTERICYFFSYIFLNPPRIDSSPTKKEEENKFHWQGDNQLKYCPDSRKESQSWSLYFCFPALGSVPGREALMARPLIKKIAKMRGPGGGAHTGQRCPKEKESICRLWVWCWMSGGLEQGQHTDGRHHTTLHLCTAYDRFIYIYTHTRSATVTGPQLR